MRDTGNVMILQVGPDPTKIMHHRHANGLQMLSGTNPGYLQQVRGVDGAAAQDDLTVGARLLDLTALTESDTNAFFALEEKSRRHGLGFDAQVRTGLGFLQERLGG